MEHIAKSADRLQVAEHPRYEQAPRTTTATSAGVSWPDVVGKRPGEPALAIVAERHGRDAARPGVAKLVHLISLIGGGPRAFSFENAEVELESDERELRDRIAWQSGRLAGGAARTAQIRPTRH